MKTFVKIAWRNIIRNRNRSLITVSAVAIGLGALIFIWSFAEGAHRQMIKNYTSFVISPVQVQALGYQKNPKLEKALKNSEELVRVIKNNPRVKAVSQRIRAEGLMGSTESSVGTMIIGVHPPHEKQVSKLHERISKGSFLNAEDNRKIIIGKNMASNLDVDIDDKVVFMSQALDGSIASGAYYVKGIIDSGVAEIDKGLALLTFQAAEDLFVMNIQPSQIGVQLHSIDESDLVAEELKETLKDPSLEILPWRKVSPVLQQWLDYDNTFIWIILIIVMIVVAIGIMNTVLMGVLERTREIGILLALGTKPQQILSMVTYESIFLGLIGTLAGLLLGLGASAYFAHTGLDLSMFSEALNSMYMEPIIHPHINYKYVWISSFVVLATSILVSIFPAWTAAKLNPVEAIRSI